MRKTSERGEMIELLLMFFALTVVIFAILIPKSGRNSFFTLPSLDNGWSVTGGTTYGLGTNTNTYSLGASMPMDDSIRIFPGNASGSYQPNEEYVTIYNGGNTAIDITGWRLENAKNSRVYSVGGSDIRYSSDTGVIPQGTRILSPSGASRLERIILKPGEEAVVVTGNPGNIAPYTLVSFKENSCTGYLRESYNIPGGSSKSCIAPRSEPGVNSLDRTCQDYINSLSSCHAPKIGGRDSQGDYCASCIDGKENLSSSCRAFIESHYSYAGCLANHMGDPGFEGRTWHVYMHKPWEMWDKDHETISLYDSLGRLMSTYSY